MVTSTIQVCDRCTIKDTDSISNRRCKVYDNWEESERELWTGAYDEALELAFYWWDKLLSEMHMSNISKEGMHGEAKEDRFQQNVSSCMKISRANVGHWNFFTITNYNHFMTRIFKMHREVLYIINIWFVMPKSTT